ncbi:MAG: membrane protein [Peptococcaceae bacterium BRH_c8a]|nr:MAG: membrane protein [Peptococcaceae bacterium BRH_c8a]
MEGTNIVTTTAILVFVCTYILIVFGIVHRTVAALAGALIMLAIGVIKPVEAFVALDFDTIGLLIGMMIIVGITKTTGLFEFLAVKAAKIARGEPVKILASLCLITAVFSAFLDNVTTVMLIIPVTLAITRRLKLTPVPFLLAIIISSNIGGTATLVGDPPNLMISGFTGMGFMDFFLNLAPIAVIVYIVTVYVMKSIFKHYLISLPALKQQVIKLNAQNELKDRALLYKCLIIILLTVLGFIFHQKVKLEPAFIAVVGAAILLLITNYNIISALKAVEWNVIVFFGSLFIMVGALDKTGIFEGLARTSLDITGGNILLTGLIILWLSALFSSFIDNIPFVAAMIPFIQDMGTIGGITDLTFFWWSLSLGSCLGGNGTAVGASANIVVIGMAEKAGVHISFINFMKIGFPLMLLSMVLSTVYLLLWYFLNVR